LHQWGLIEGPGSSPVQVEPREKPVSYNERANLSFHIFLDTFIYQLTGSSPVHWTGEDLCLIEKGANYTTYFRLVKVVAFKERRSRELLERERARDLVCSARGGGRFYASLPWWWCPPCPYRGGFFVLHLLDLVEFRCFPAIRVVKCCPPRLDPVVVVVPCQKTSRFWVGVRLFWWSWGNSLLFVVCAEM
jgi:hypothetical protein